MTITNNQAHATTLPLRDAPRARNTHPATPFSVLVTNSAGTASRGASAPLAPVSPLASWVAVRPPSVSAPKPANPVIAEPVPPPPANPLASWVTVPPAGPTPAAPVTNPGAQPGIGALVDAIMNGTFQPTNVTDPTKLQEVSPIGVHHMSSMFYASDDTAQQLAQLLGGKVVQKPAFAVPSGWQEPMANFIQLPGGQTVNAADLAYYARSRNYGAGQLYADLTAEINQGAVVSGYNDAMQSFLNGTGQNPGAFPGFPVGDVGPAIAGMTYPAGTLNPDGTVINPAMPNKT